MNVFILFWNILEKTQKSSLIFLVFFMIIGAFLEALGVSLLLPLISVITSDDLTFPRLILLVFPSLESVSKIELIFNALLLFIIFYIFKSFVLFYLIKKQSQFIYKIQETISTRLYRVYLRQPYSFHLQKNSGKIISNTITEAMQFAMGFTSPLIYFFTDIFILIGIFILLLMVEPIGALASLALFSIGSYILYYISKRKSSQWGEMRQIYEAQRMQSAQQGINGIKDVKLYSREEEFSMHYSKNTNISLNSALKQTILQNIPKIFFEMLAVLSLSVLIYVLLINNTSPEVLIATLGVFAMSAFKLLPSVARLVANLQAFRFTIPVVKIIDNALELEKNDLDNINIKEITFNKSIDLNAINFSYEGMNTKALYDINISIPFGKTVGFIGPSGAGKSTIIDIILCLLSPTTGDISIDSKKLNIESIPSWQNKIGYVPQSIYLLDDTLRKNIAFGIASEKIDDKRVLLAASLAQLDNFIDTLPEKFNTVIGERGVRLSGGQRQRIGIARALYDDPPVLVLDEATSSLDIITENEVMDSVKKLQGNKTILIIAHRFSTVEHCDYIYKIEKGKIALQGKPNDILLN